MILSNWISSQKSFTLVIVFIVLISISLLGMIGTLIVLFLYKKIVELAYKSSRTLEVVDYTPLIKWIANVYAIAAKDKGNRYIDQSFEILFRNYYELYGQRFPKLTRQVAEFLNNNSNRSRPLFSNYLRIKEINKNVQYLGLEVRECVANVYDILELQRLTRDWYVIINDKANNVLDLIKANNEKKSNEYSEIWGPKTLSESKLYDLYEKILSTRTNIIYAKYSDAVANLKEVSSLLGDLTRFIDSTNKIIYLVDDQLRERLSAIIKEIESLHWGQKEKEKNIAAFSALYNSYFKFIKDTKRDIYSLNIENAYARSHIMIDQIKKHETNLKYEMLIKDFIKSNHKNLQNVLSECKNDILKTSEVINFNEKFGKRVVAQIQKLSEIKKSHANLEIKANALFAEELDSKEVKYVTNHKKKGQEIKEIYERAKIMLNELATIRAALQSEEDILNKLESKTLSFRKMLLVMELVVAKNPKILELKNFTPIIKEGFERLAEYENVLVNDKEIFNSKNTYEEFSDFLDDKNLTIARCKQEMAQIVFIAKLSEVSLGYMARFGGIESFDKDIQIAIDKFENAEYKECLNQNISFLKKIKERKIATGS